MKVRTTRSDLRKTVVLKVEFECVVSVPEDWDEDMVNFWFNESSWCWDNLWQDLARVADAVEPEALSEDPNTGCSCGSLDPSAKYLRDAKPEDHRQRWWVDRREGDAVEVES